jgi:hypothetical protein
MDSSLPEWRNMRVVARVVYIIALVFTNAIVLAAQTVRGTVVLSDGSTPAASVIVIATDVRGTAAGRALTSPAGQFTIGVPAGRYGFTLLRIGFRPTRIAEMNIDDASEALHFVLADQPVALSAVNVRERETCRVNADTGFMVARVWEEARKAMLTTQLTSEGAPLFAEWIEYDRMLDSAARLVREQHVHISRNPTTHAFRSRPAAVLDSVGYVVADSTGTMYFAPDAEVLLSESFAAGHCFHLVASPSAGGTPELIGVAFQPTRERRDKREIEGTLWVDRATSELRTLEFRYTNMPDVVRAAAPGGRVEFLRLPGGNWLVDRWHVRMPLVGAARKSTANGLGRVVISGSVAAIRGIQVTGGEVTRVTRHDTLVHQAAGPSITIQVVSRDSLLPGSGASLTLEGTDYAAVANASGQVRLTPVLAGRYRARVSTPLMDSLGMPPITRDVETREDAHVDSLTLPRTRDALVAACTRDSVSNGEGMLHGVVRDERDRAIQAAAVTVTWKGNFYAAATRDGGQLGYTEKTLGAMSNDAGYWRVCGVPRETPLSVHVVTDSGSDLRRVRLDGGVEFAAVDLVLHRSLPAATREAETAAAAGRPPTARALVEVAVTELGGSPLPDATVEIIGEGGTHTVVTGPGGRALVPDIAPGLLVFRTKHVGFKQGQIAVTIEPGRNTVPILLSTVSLPTLDTVRIVGNQRLIGIRRNDEFETRRINHTATVSFTHEDIVKRNPVDAWQMLTAVPSVRIVDSAGVTAESTRSLNVNPDLSVSKCYMTVMVDGLVMNSGPGQLTFDLRLLPKPEAIHGIEVFAGPASIPLQYSGIGKDKWCGLIAIWTR